MTYSTLKRKTPLKNKGTGLCRVPFKKKAVALLPKGGAEKATEAKEKPKKAKQQTRSSLETHLDIVFSLYIRLRDAMDGGRVRCISCGRIFPFNVIQCGHFFSRSNRSTRWDEQNCNSQCCECNCDKHGNIESYRPALIAKIGQQQFDELSERAHGERKWSGEELKDMIKHYTTEVKRLSKEKSISVRI